MIDRNQLVQLVRSNPQLQSAVEEIQRRLQGMNLTPQLIAEVIHSLEYALANPDKYPQIRAEAIRRGFGTEETIPPQYDKLFLISMMAAFYGLLDRVERSQEEQTLAHGGLAHAARQLQAQGRGGDTILAHINPIEAEVLRRMGGSGTVNPHTGLMEFKGGVLGDIFKVVVPVAAMFVAPYIAPMLGGSMMAAGAVTGGLASAMTGGNLLQGAAFGALGNGLGSSLGSSLAPEMSSAAQNALGSGLVGGAMGAATGQGVLKGAAQGALGSYLGNQVQGVAGSGALGAGVNQAGTQFGNLMAAGFTPAQSVVGAGLSGLVAGLNARPSDVVSNPVNQAETQTYEFKNPVEEFKARSSTDAYSPNTSDGGFLSNLNNNQLMMGAMALSAMQGAPEPVQQAVSTMSPEQQAYFNRPSIKWDWDTLQRDANTSGQGLAQYMAQNWNKITSGQYNQPSYSQGGLSQVAALMSGIGSGRDDTIEARLSDGEYVVDAETVAMLGDGSVKEGARKLDEMRSRIRQHKGKSLARGKISPNAKSAETYLKGTK